MSRTKMGATEAQRLYNERHLADPRGTEHDAFFQRWSEVRLALLSAEPGPARDALEVELREIQETFFRGSH